MTEQVEKIKNVKIEKENEISPVRVFPIILHYLCQKIHKRYHKDEYETDEVCYLNFFLFTFLKYLWYDEYLGNNFIIETNKDKYKALVNVIVRSGNSTLA